MFDKVLLATDGSPESERAARMAVELTNGLGSELHVVHVGLVPSDEMPSSHIVLTSCYGGEAPDLRCGVPGGLPLTR